MGTHKELCKLLEGELNYFLSLLFTQRVIFLKRIIDNPSVTEMLDIFIGFGPVAHVKYITNTFLRILADLRIDDLFEILGLRSFGNPFKGALKYLFELLCFETPISCDNVIEAICGRHKGAFNDTKMDVVVAHEPGGTSVQNMAHWSQAVVSGQFQFYDYGKKGNEEHYNSTSPPLYNCSMIPESFPIALFSGGQDELADPTDVAYLVANLRKNIVFWKQLPNYAHLDFGEFFVYSYSFLNLTFFKKFGVSLPTWICTLRFWN